MKGLDMEEVSSEGKLASRDRKLGVLSHFSVASGGEKQR